MIKKLINKLFKSNKCSIDELEAPLFECGPGHFTQGYGFFVGVPAPVILPDDPWFGPTPIKSEKQIKYQKWQKKQKVLLKKL